MLAPEKVFRASGHLEKFSDFKVENIVTGQVVRADHLLQQYINQLILKKDWEPELKKRYLKISNQADGFNADELQEHLREFHSLLYPSQKNYLSFVKPFNLMFSTQIGAEGNNVGYMRPETAQGIFLNFKKLLEYNSGKLPFAGAQIGYAFRNEISPRSGLLRCREFLLAEIEHFYDKQANIEGIDDMCQFSDFKISVEFNNLECDDNSLPIVHTCENTIKL